MKAKKERKIQGERDIKQTPKREGRTNRWMDKQIDRQKNSQTNR